MHLLAALPASGGNSACLYRFNRHERPRRAPSSRYCKAAAGYMIHSALPTLDSHEPACSFFFFCSASLQGGVTNAQTQNWILVRKLQNAARDDLAATLSFLAVLCITIAFPLACSSGGVMYLSPQRQQALRQRCGQCCLTWASQSRRPPCSRRRPSPPFPDSP